MDSECPPGGNCVDYVCQGGYDIGEDCTSTSQCKYGLFCNSTWQCDNQKELVSYLLLVTYQFCQGEKCSYEENDQQICKMGLICSLEGQCINPFSKSAGESCIVGQIECAPPMACSPEWRQCTGNSTGPSSSISD